MDIAAFLLSLESTRLAVAIRTTPLAFPLVESLHVIGLTLVFGTVMVIDLRLLGLAWTRRPFSSIADDVLPWTWLAFGTAVVTGSLMFTTSATGYCVNWYFRAKLLTLVLAGLNMGFFQLTDRRSLSTWDCERSAPLAGKIAAATSLALWILIIVLGRWTAFAQAAAAPPPGEGVDFDQLEELVK